ncbi:hypothetical protein RI367_005785 [Sorochytrium milnesiophthora]
MLAAVCSVVAATIAAASALVYVYLLQAASGSRIRATAASTPIATVERYLLVVAHPDDECMFFAPILLQLARRGESVWVLCLSTGGYYELGAVRKNELVRSCQALGVPSDRVAVVDDSNLPDNPTVMWDATVVLDKVIAHKKKHNITTIITFDDRGVSGHINHRAIWQALESGKKTHETALKGTTIATLRSTSTVRKYISLFDMLFTATLDLNGKDQSAVASTGPKQWLALSTLSDVWQARQAMYCHRSQLVWFRRLYILFSRYMVVNVLDVHRA